LDFVRTSRQVLTEDHLSNNQAGNESYEYHAINESGSSIQDNHNNLNPEHLNNVETIGEDTPHAMNYEHNVFKDTEQDHEMSPMESDADFSEASKSSYSNDFNDAYNYDSEMQSECGHDDGDLNEVNASIDGEGEIIVEHEAINVVNATMMLAEQDNASENATFMEKALSLSLDDFLKVFVLLFSPVRSGMDLFLKFLKLNWEAASHLPATVRTLLKTPRQSVARDVAPGKYIHFGLINSLECKSGVNYEQIHRKSGGVIELILHWDGAEGVKSKKTTIWPLQILIRGHKLRPSLVGIYYGHSKPESFDIFLKDIVEDLLSMRDQGTGQDVIVLKGFKFTVKRLIFLADSPAKCAALGIFSPVSFCGCTRCKIIAVHGKRHNNEVLRGI